MAIRHFTVGDTYISTCWFTGGTTRYTVTNRTDSEVTFCPVHHEIDGVHEGESETFQLKMDGENEYVVIQEYHGEENRLYA